MFKKRYFLTICLMSLPGMLLSACSSDENTDDMKSVDTVAPVITGVEDRTFTPYDSITYMKGVQATDDVDGQVEVSVDKSSVKTDENGNIVVGTYEIIYSATDAAGNTATQTATFEIQELTVSDEMLEELASAVLDEITAEDMTIEQKAYAIYEYVYNNVTYTGSSEKGDYKKAAYIGLKNMSGDCYTCFSISKLLLEHIGAETIDMERTSDVRDGEHYWLLVNLGDGYYHFDALKQSTGFYSFMLTDAEVDAYSKDVIEGYYDRDISEYPATPTEKFEFTEYVAE